MAQAIRLSIENVENGSGGPFGCVIVKDNKIIATGVNQVTLTNDPTAHAEMVAIRTACKILGSFQLTGCDIYTSCQPCPMCFGAIYWARPARVFFAATKDDAAAINFDDSFIYEQLQLSFDQQIIPMQQLMTTQAIKAFDLWKDSLTKTAY